jgi:hypothetical protein
VGLLRVGEGKWRRHGLPGQQRIVCGSLFSSSLASASCGTHVDTIRKPEGCGVAWSMSLWQSARLQGVTIGDLTIALSNANRAVALLSRCLLNALPMGCILPTCVGLGTWTLMRAARSQLRATSLTLPVSTPSRLLRSGIRRARPCSLVYGRSHAPSFARHSTSVSSAPLCE